jgi:hypothetical protein
MLQIAGPMAYPKQEQPIACATIPFVDRQKTPLHPDGEVMTGSTKILK